MASTADEESEKLRNIEKISLSTLMNAQSTLNSNLDAGQLLADAVEAAEEAERLENEAEAALSEVEAALAQHEIDFPDNDS